MEEENQHDVGDMLSKHSNEGTLHLLSSAFHFLTSRLIYQQVWQDTVSEADFDRLAKEAWSGFVYPGLLSYHTWLVEVTDGATADLMREVWVHELISEIQGDWNVWVADTKLEWLNEFST